MEKLEEYYRNLSSLILGGLIAISLIIFQDLVSLGNLDIPAKIAIIGFAIAIPLLVFSLLFRQVPHLRDKQHKYISMTIMTTVGVICDITGITATFFHVLIPAGILFIISGIIGFIIYVIVERDIKVKKQQEEKRIQQEEEQEQNLV